jgi:hypothetical protein
MLEIHTEIYANFLVECQLIFLIATQVVRRILMEVHQNSSFGADTRSQTDK